MLDPLALFQVPTEIKEEQFPKRQSVDINLVCFLFLRKSHIFQYRNIKITLVNNPSPRSIDNMGNSSLHDDELNS